jgi:hypothetical protein
MPAIPADCTPLFGALGFYVDMDFQPLPLQQMFHGTARRQTRFAEVESVAAQVGPTQALVLRLLGPGAQTSTCGWQAKTSASTTSASDGGWPPTIKRGRPTATRTGPVPAGA